MKNMEEFYRENADTVYRFLLFLGGDAALSEELTAETLFRGVKKIDSFREECLVSTWLCAIARNLYYDEQKRRGRTLPLDEAIGKNDAEENVESTAIDKVDAEKIRAILETLSEPYAAVFSFHVLGEIPLCEIAALYGKSESWARVTYFRAKVMIKEKLGGIS